ncbi:hypothetical protein TWF506_002914 [Arthrobotrys conoides]|uniref:Uncharacterized protein n=1 Tax=Arthrobotrys conoides TaxID=74498 RepID=A0AAN8RR84_9PEZI
MMKNTNKSAPKLRPPLVKPTLKKPEPVKEKALPRRKIKFKDDDEVSEFVEQPAYTICSIREPPKKNSRKSTPIPVARVSSSPEPEQRQRLEPLEEEEERDAVLHHGAVTPAIEDLESYEREGESGAEVDEKRQNPANPNFPLLKLKGHTFPRKKVVIPYNPTTDDEEEELLEQWATDPVLESVRNLRSTIYPTDQITTEKYIPIEEDKDIGLLYNPEDAIYDIKDPDHDSEELFHRLDTMQIDTGMDDMEGYSMEEITGYREEEDEKERLEWMLWTVGAIVVVLIAIILVVLGAGWKPFTMGGQVNRSPKHAHVPQSNLSKVAAPSRLKTAPSNYRGVKGMVLNFCRAAGLAKETFMAAGVGYVTQGVVEKKGIWETVKNGDLKKTALEKVKSWDLNGLFGGKKRKWW